MNCKLLSLLLFTYIGFSSCGSVHPSTAFDANKVPPAPDYSNLENWAAHPDKSDPSDLTPSPTLQMAGKDAPVDVFFLYPTTYTGDLRSQRNWNASVSDQKTNEKTDKGTIQYQASIFNGIGRVFAPRYRQAHLYAFLTKKDTAAARQALELAYLDTKAAFKYYLEHWNNGRPFILAGHSQGALHTMSIIREMVEGTPLESQLVAAFIVGWPVKINYYKTFKPCQSPDQTDCFCSWRTWERNFGLQMSTDQNTVCTNPLTWHTTDNEYAPKTLNKGGVIRPFEKIYPEVTDAEVYNGILLASKPTFKGSIFFRRKNYHVGDFNLYYMNVRENAQLRTKAFLKR